MEKRGQLAIFIMMGFILLIAIAFFYLFTGGGSLQNSNSQLQAMTLRSLSMKEYVRACIEEKALEGVEAFGVSEGASPAVQAYIERNLEGCVDLNDIRNEGYAVSAGSPDAKVRITESNLLAEVTYPLTIRKDREEQVLSRFSYVLDKEREIPIELDSSGKTVHPITIIAADRRASLLIPAGTTALDSAGNPLTSISIKLLDRHFNGLDNAVLVGTVAYELSPAGASFSPHIQLAVEYRLEDVPIAVAPDSLTVSRHDAERGFWKSQPSTVDEAAHTVSAAVDHFSVWGITYSCKGTVSEQAVFTDWIYQEPLYSPCLGWDSTSKAPSIFAIQGMAGIVQRDYSSSSNQITPNEPGPYDRLVLDWDQDDQVENSCACDFSCAADCHEAAVQYCGALGIAASVLGTGDGVGDTLADSMPCMCSEIPFAPGRLDITATCATPDSYGYSAVEQAGGKGIFAFALIPDGNTCLEQGASVRINLECDDTCESVLLNGVEILPNGLIEGTVYPAPATSGSGVLQFERKTYEVQTSLLSSKAVNILEVIVKNTQEACSSARGSVVIKGIGMQSIPECPAGAAITGNCRCGGTTITVARELPSLDQSGAYVLGGQFSGETLVQYCCSDGFVVNDLSECVSSTQCTPGELSSAYDGCLCGRTAYFERLYGVQECCQYGNFAVQCAPDDSNIAYPSRDSTEAELRSMVLEQARQLDIPETYALAIAFIEQGGYLRGGNNIMQVSADTAAATCTDADISTAEGNIRCGLEILKTKCAEVGCDTGGAYYYDCTGTEYTGWDAATRLYNGGGCPSHEGRYYVEIANCYREQFNSVLPVQRCVIQDGIAKVTAN